MEFNGSLVVSETKKATASNLQGKSPIMVVIIPAKQEVSIGKIWQRIVYEKC